VGLWAQSASAVVDLAGTVRRRERRASVEIDVVPARNRSGCDGVRQVSARQIAIGKDALDGIYGFPDYYGTAVPPPLVHEGSNSGAALRGEAVCTPVDVRDGCS